MTNGETHRNYLIDNLDVGPGTEVTLAYSVNKPVTNAAWTQIAGPLVALSPIGSDNHATVTFEAPGVYRFRLDAVEATATGEPVAPVFAEVRVSAPQFLLMTSDGVVKSVHTDLHAAIDAASTGDTIQVPAGRVTSGAGFAAGVTVYAKHGITIQGAGSEVNGTLLVFVGPQEWPNAGFSIKNSSDISIKGMRFHNPSMSFGTLIHVENSQVAFDSIAFEESHVFYTPGIVSTTNSSVEVKNSDFRNLSSGISVGNCGSAIIENNRFEALIGTAVLIDMQDCSTGNVSVRDNVFDMQQAGTPINVRNYTVPGGSLEILNNFVTDVPYSALDIGPVATATPVRIEGNTLGGDSRWGWANRYGIHLKGTGNFEIAHNTIYGFSKSAIYNEAGSVGAWGNVLSYSLHGYGIENKAFACDTTCTPMAWAAHNLTYRNGNGNFLNVDVRDEGLEADPLFANPDAGNFTFTSASPLSTMDAGARDRTPLPGPEGLKAEPGPESVSLTFDHVAGAVKYTVYWGDQPGAYPQSEEVGLHTFAKITGLKVQPYHFVVRAHDGMREGEASVAVVAAPLSGEPSPEVAVDGVEPARIPARKGVELTIVGSGFVKGAKVFAGSTKVKVLEITPHQIRVRIPKTLSAGIYPVAVVNKDLSRGVLHEALTVYTPSRSAPQSGCATGEAAALWWLLMPLAYRLRRRVL